MLLLNFFYFCIHPDLHAVLVGFPEKTMYDGSRIIRHRKHPSILFGFCCNTSFFKPTNCISSKELMKSFLYKVLSSWVLLAHFTNIEEGVCYIASAASGYADL